MKRDRGRNRDKESKRGKGGDRIDREKRKIMREAVGERVR